MIYPPTSKVPSLFRRILLSLGKAILFTVLCALFSILILRPLGALIPPDQAAALDEGISATAPVWILNLTYLVVSISALLALFIVRQLIGKQSLISAGLGTVKWPAEFGEGWLLGMGLVAAGYLLLVIAGLAQSQGWNFAFNTFLGWLLLFLIQPFFEELLFRGYLMSLLARYFNLSVAIIVSSLAFALVHGTNAGFTGMGFVTISVAGLLFGLLFLKTGQLWLPTGMHAAWNFTQGVVFGFPTSGIRTYAITETTTSGPDWLSGGNFGFEGSILAVLLIIAAIWWYRKSWEQEQLSPMIEQSFKTTTPTATPDILDEQME